MIQGTQDKIIRLAGLLFCLCLSVILGLGKVGGNCTPTGEAEASSARCVRVQRLDSSGFLQATDPRRSPVLEPHQRQSMQTRLSFSDLFEEENDSVFNILASIASHIGLARSDQSRRSSVRMKPAACPTRIYLVNSTLLC
jgi:hypothetical protein